MSIATEFQSFFYALSSALVSCQLWCKDINRKKPQTHVSSRYRVAYNKDTGACKLEISMTFADDAGEYTIFARNPLGEISASVMLLDEGWFSGWLYYELQWYFRSIVNRVFLHFTEAYELYVKKQEETFKTEVTTIIEEPKVAEISAVVETVTEKEQMLMQRRMAQQTQMMQSFISEQVWKV